MHRGQTSEIWKGQANLPKVLILWMSACFGKNYSKSYNILLPYVLYCIHFLRTCACVCRTSENCKSLVLQDKCNIEIFPSPDASPVWDPHQQANIKALEQVQRCVARYMYLTITKQEPQDASQRCFTTLNRSHLKIGQAHALQNAGDM